MKILKKIILLLITFCFLYLVIKNLNFKELYIILKGFNLKYLIFLVLAIILSASFRALCYKRLISKTVKIPLKELIPLCLTGSALNILLPARAGDIFRAYYTGLKYNADKVKLFGTVMLERIFDGLIILTMLFLGIFLYNKNPLAQRLCILGGIIFIGCAVIALFMVKFKKIDSVCNFIINKTDFLPEKIKNLFHSFINFTNKTCNSFINGFEILLYPKEIILVLLTSSCIWICEASKYYIIIKGFNIDVSASITLFIESFLALACMIPSTSIYIGPYQFAIISACSIYNINKETALAASLVEQTAVTLTTGIIAFLFLLRNNIHFKDIQKDINKENNN